MFKGTLQPDNMLLIFRISLLQLVQDLCFLQARLVPGESQCMVDLVYRERCYAYTHIDSWHRTILIATSLPISFASP